MEIWDAYDRHGNKLDAKLIRGEPIPEGMYHLAVHAIFCNSKGQLLLQRRSDTKELAPGVWAFTGGSALTGEDSAAACIRETTEEMGFVPDMSDAECVFRLVREDNITDVFIIHTEVGINELVLQPEEVAEAKWFGKAEFLELIADQKRFWGYSYMDSLLDYLEKNKYIN